MSREERSSDLHHTIDEARHHIVPSLKNCFTDPHLNLLTSVNQALGILDLAPRIRRKCVKPLYKMCASHTLLPTSLSSRSMGQPDNNRTEILSFYLYLLPILLLVAP